MRFFGDPGPIQKDYLIRDFLADIGHLPVRGSVHVQVGAVAEDAVKESRWLQSVSKQPEARGLPNAIVGFCDLSAGNAAAVLEGHREYANLRGVRQIVGRSPAEDARSGSGALLENSHWLKGLSLLADIGLCFDLQILPAHAEDAKRVFARLPDLKVALCHCGSPAEQSAEGIRVWKAGLQSLAELPNLYCKLSGFGMFDRHWSADSIRPLVLHAIDCFRPERCMFGSNFPVDKLYAEYVAVWGAYDEVTADFSREERAQMFYRTAREFYSIDV